ncbi:hypothetical protein Peur_026464 [Populus x canadensis]
MDRHHNEPNHEDEPNNAKFTRPLSGDGASTGKIFIGAQFIKHFGEYGEITDSVIMNDRKTGQPRGFGFVTYSDPSAVDQVVQDTHIINGKQVEIKRTIPKGAAGSKDFKTKKIIVGGIPAVMSSRNCLLSERLQNIRSCGTTPPIVLVGSGFITFDTEKAVDDLLAKGFKLELAGIQPTASEASSRRKGMFLGVEPGCGS